MPVDALRLSDLRSLIPDRCFEVLPLRALAYLSWDVALIAASYVAMAHMPVWFVEAPLIFLVGTLCWAIFVLGHDAGHGVFLPGRRANLIAGTVMHGMLLVPFRAWQRSHALHHAGTGHIEREEVFRASRPGQTGPAYAVFFRSGLFVLFGWPLYKLGLRNIGTCSLIRSGHYLPGSDLMAPAYRVSWYAGTLCVLASLSLYLGLFAIFGFVFFMKYILAPYFIYSGWLTFTTWMQHVSEQVPVYEAADWTPLKGALCTVDRDYGVFGWLTHRTGTCHVIHHLFPHIPHYHLPAATRAVRPALGRYYLQSKRFVLIDFIHSLRHCHVVVPADGRLAYRPAREVSSTDQTAGDVT